MKERRYQVGQQWRFRNGRMWIEQGDKSPNDIRLMVEIRPGGASVPMSAVAIALDALFEAEDIAWERPKYKDQKTFKGYKLMREFCEDVYHMGPKQAVAKRRAAGEQIEFPMFIEVNEDGEA